MPKFSSLQGKLVDLMRELVNYCHISKDTWSSGKSFILSFDFDGAVTTVRIVLDDYSGAGLVITNMTTMPLDQTRKGHGSKALQLILQEALREGLDLNGILAVQVQAESESFWIRNGFVKLNDKTNDFVYKKHSAD